MPRGRILRDAQGKPYRPRASAGYVDRDAQVDEAVRRGYEEGLEKARAEIARERDAFAEERARGLAEMQSLRQQIIEQTRAEVVSLALVAAARIVRARIDGGDYVAGRILEEILGEIDERIEMKVRAHPEDVEMLSQTVQAMDLEAVAVAADPRIARGGLVVETSQEEIDARLETALGAIADVVRQES